MKKTQIILDFLSQLKVNNNREWFNENKAKFLEVKDAFESLTQTMIELLQMHDENLKNIVAKDCVFRIYRDVRFGKDKSPYKTHLGAYINRTGRKGDTCGYYFHLEPGATILAGGVYCPPSPLLFEVRDAIYADTEEFKAIINTDDFKRLFGEIEGEKLKRAPKGFPKDFEDIELLKHKSFLITNSISDDMLLKDDFTHYSLEVFNAMKPFNDFLNRAILSVEE